MVPLAQAVGRPLDEAMIMICITISFIISLILSHIKSPFLRKIINTSTGVLISTYTYGLGVFLVIPYNMIGFIFMTYAPREKAHTYTIILTLSILTFAHLLV